MEEINYEIMLMSHEHLSNLLLVFCLFQLGFIQNHNIVEIIYVASQRNSYVRTFHGCQYFAIAQKHILRVQ